jgi:hypothetical protein
MAGYAKDLMQAMQNHFQSDLFDNYKIPKRKPRDASKVLPTPD